MQTTDQAITLWLVDNYTLLSSSHDTRTVTTNSPITEKLTQRTYRKTSVSKPTRKSFTQSTKTELKGCRLVHEPGLRRDYQAQISQQPESEGQRATIVPRGTVTDIVSQETIILTEPASANDITGDVKDIKEIFAVASKVNKDRTNRRKNSLS